MENFSPSVQFREAFQFWRRGKLEFQSEFNATMPLFVDAQGQASQRRLSYWAGFASANAIQLEYNPSKFHKRMWRNW
jgi:hypothetical protein